MATADSSDSTLVAEPRIALGAKIRVCNPVGKQLLSLSVDGIYVSCEMDVARLASNPG